MSADIVNILDQQQTSGARFPTFASTRVASKFMFGITLETVKGHGISLRPSFRRPLPATSCTSLLDDVGGISSRRELLALIRQFYLFFVHTFGHIILNLGCQMFFFKGKCTGLTATLFATNVIDSPLC